MSPELAAANVTPAVQQALSSVTAQQVHDLRESSGEGMVKCKEMLFGEAFDKAIAEVVTQTDIRFLLEAANTLTQVKAVIRLMLDHPA